MWARVSPGGGPETHLDRSGAGRGSGLDDEAQTGSELSSLASCRKGLLARAADNQPVIEVEVLVDLFALSMEERGNRLGNAREYPGKVEGRTVGL